MPTRDAIFVRCACPTRHVRTANPTCACSSSPLLCEVCSGPTTTCPCIAPDCGYPVVWVVSHWSCGPFGGRSSHRPAVALWSAPRTPPATTPPTATDVSRSMVWRLDGGLRACSAVCDRQVSGGAACGASSSTVLQPIANFRKIGVLVVGRTPPPASWSFHDHTAGLVGHVGGHSRGIEVRRRFYQRLRRFAVMFFKRVFSSTFRRFR